MRQRFCGGSVRRRWSRLAGVAVLSGFFTAVPALAETPSDVAAEIADDGVYISLLRQGVTNESTLANSVARARSQGIDLAVVIPLEAHPDGEAFALRVLEASAAQQFDVVVVIDAEGVAQVALIDDYHERSLRVLEAARSDADPAATIDSMVTALQIEQATSVPVAVNMISTWVFVLVLVLGVAVVGDIILRQRRRDRWRAHRGADTAPTSELSH